MKSQDLFPLKKKKKYIYIYIYINLECRLLQIFLGTLRVNLIRTKIRKKNNDTVRGYYFSLINLRFSLLLKKSPKDG